MRRLFALTLMLVFGAVVNAQEVNVYSAREENLIKPLLDKFTQQSGIKVNLITGGADELITRMANEGANSPADVLLTVDVGRLYRAQQQNLLSPVQSALLSERIPAQYRESADHWFAMSLRSRVVVYSKDRVDPAQLESYEGLADPRWLGKICVRSSSNIYNQSLTASMISHHGAAATETWAKGIVANLARNPQGGDRDQISAVVAGQCDLAIVNTYYLAGMLNSSSADDRAVAAQVAVFWPNQADRGTHINISGAGVARYAPNRASAIQLMEFMVNDESQSWYADVNGEFPVRDGIAVSEALKQWGPFKADALPLEQLGINAAEAVRVMDRAGWK